MLKSTDEGSFNLYATFKYRASVNLARGVAFQYKRTTTNLEVVIQRGCCVALSDTIIALPRCTNCYFEFVACCPALSRSFAVFCISAVTDASLLGGRLAGLMK